MLLICLRKHKETNRWKSKCFLFLGTSFIILCSEITQILKIYSEKCKRVQMKNNKDLCLCVCVIPIYNVVYLGESKWSYNVLSLSDTLMLSD